MAHPDDPSATRVDIGVLTVIPPELEAARAALGGLSRRPKESAHDTVYWEGVVRSELCQREYGVVLAGIGGAGNPGAAALATQMMERFRPRILLLMGIAAGVRGKVKIGEVVLSERVVAYESLALVEAEDGSHRVQPRPEIPRVAHGVQQDVLNYRPDGKRLADRFGRIQGVFPVPPPGPQEDWSRYVVAEVACRPHVTIAAGEKLLRDPTKLTALREIHGKIEAVEMEAAGVVTACAQQNVPWLVIRGISDFGDSLKDDRFHTFASRTAAVVLADFIAHGLDLGRDAGRAVAPAVAPSRKSPYVVGPPIEREQDFFGRTLETERILEAIGNGQAVQILGPMKVGKSSLLRWVERKAPEGRPVVLIEPGAGLTPVMLVKGIAAKLGSIEIAARLERKGATVDEAAEQLRALGRMVLLIDDADKLPQVGKGYTEGFFEVVRGRVEDRAIIWVSASRRDLYGQFKEKGLSSRFFTSTEKLWIGPIENAAARRLAALGDSVHVGRLLEEAGRFGYGLQWLGNRLAHGDGVDDACIRFRAAMEPIFRSWWEELTPGEHAVLKQCAREEMAMAQQDEALRQQLLRLTDAGHLERVGSHYRLVGNAWRDFVRHAR
jgi:nucleoside phosphorylase